MRPHSSCPRHCRFHHYVERELLPAKDVEENMQKQIVSVQFLSIIVLVESTPLGEIGYVYNLRSGHWIKSTLRTQNSKCTFAGGTRCVGFLCASSGWFDHIKGMSGVFSVPQCVLFGVVRCGQPPELWYKHPTHPLTHAKVHLSTLCQLPTWLHAERDMRPYQLRC